MLVKEIFPAVRDLRVDRFGVILFASALRGGKRWLEISVEALGLNRFQIEIQKAI